MLHRCWCLHESESIGGGFIVRSLDVSQGKLMPYQSRRGCVSLRAGDRIATTRNLLRTTPPVLPIYAVGVEFGSKYKRTTPYRIWKVVRRQYTIHGLPCGTNALIVPTLPMSTIRPRQLLRATRFPCSRAPKLSPTTRSCSNRDTNLQSCVCRWHVKASDMAGADSYREPGSNLKVFIDSVSCRRTVSS